MLGLTSSALTVTEVVTGVIFLTQRLALAAAWFFQSTGQLV